MLKGLKFDDKVGSDVTWRLVAHSLEAELGALRETRFHLDLLACANRTKRLGIMVDNFALVVDLLDGAAI